MRGDKKVEFRKQQFARPVEHVVIYATAPVQRVIGTFRVGECDIAKPAELWRRHGDVGGIERHAFEDYYRDARFGVAITVGGVPVPLDLPLAAVDQRRPPQSFTYLSSEAASRIALEASNCLSNSVAIDARTATQSDGQGVARWCRATVHALFAVASSVLAGWPSSRRQEASGERPS